MYEILSGLYTGFHLAQPPGRIASSSLSITDSSLVFLSSVHKALHNRSAISSELSFGTSPRSSASFNAQIILICYVISLEQSGELLYKTAREIQSVDGN